MSGITDRAAVTASGRDRLHSLRFAVTWTGRPPWVPRIALLIGRALAAAAILIGRVMFTAAGASELKPPHAFPAHGELQPLLRHAPDDAIPRQADLLARLYRGRVYELLAIVFAMHRRTGEFRELRDPEAPRPVTFAEAYDAWRPRWTAEAVGTRLQQLGQPTTRGPRRIYRLDALQLPAHADGATGADALRR